jgi:drug/metabolite transporter (DMT)-like permease
MTPRQLGLLVLLSALWGNMFLLVKYALMDFSAMEVAFFQAAIGAVGLFVIVGIQGGEARPSLVTSCVGPDRRSCSEHSRSPRRLC